MDVEFEIDSQLWTGNVCSQEQTPLKELLEVRRLMIATVGSGPI